MAKKMCKWKKVEKDLAAFKEAVQPARFGCAKCARVASSKKLVCKPVSLKD